MESLFIFKPGKTINSGIWKILFFNKNKMLVKKHTTNILYIFLK